MPWEGTHCKSIVSSFLVGHLPFPRNSNGVRHWEGHFGMANHLSVVLSPHALTCFEGTQTYRVRTDRLATCNNRILTHPADHIQAHPNSLSGAQTSDGAIAQRGMDARLLGLVCVVCIGLSGYLCLVPAA